MIVKDVLKKRVEYSKSLPKFQSVVKKWQLTGRGFVSVRRLELRNLKISTNEN